MTSDVTGCVDVTWRRAWPARMSSRSMVPSGPAGDRPDRGAADDGMATGLVDDDVGLGLGDDLAAARHVGHVRHEVAHRAAGHEEAGLLAGELGGALLQRVDGGVLSEDVVARPRPRPWRAASPAWVA